MAPAQAFENRLCGGNSLQLQLSQLGPNPNAIGAKLELKVPAGSQYRDVHVVSGHISSDAPRVHFSFARDLSPTELIIHWPDGTQSTVAAPAPNQILEVTR